jgi:hypothetical protein
VYQWVERKQIGRTRTNDDVLGHPTTSQMVDNVEQVNDLVQDDRLLSPKQAEVGYELWIYIFH